MIFFDMIDEGDERDDVDRGGDVAERVQLVGWDEVARLPDDRDADLADLLDELVDQLDPEARDRLQLVERSPEWPSPRRTSYRAGHRVAATIGPTASGVLSPTPPVECLSTTRRPSRWRGRLSPEWIIASVSACVSRPVRPLK